MDLNDSDRLAIDQGCYFDERAGRRPILFIQKFCKQSKGRWAGQPLTLLDWERDALMRIFGWRKADGSRRFRTVYIEVPKKNGKSTLVSAITIYLEVADDEKAPEIYLNAVTKKQADIVFEEACRMVENSPDLAPRLLVSRFYGTITDPKRYGKIQKNSADAPAADGVNGSGIIFDEIHRFRNRTQWDVFTYAGISRTNPIRIAITTAGEEPEGVWWDERQFSEQVNAGIVRNTTHLGIVYRARTSADGEPDDLDDPETWKRVNPSMGHTMSIEDFKAEFEAAKAKRGAELGNFLRLRLGIVCRAEGKFFADGEWESCDGQVDPCLTDPCYMGLDLSDREDLTALVCITGSIEAGFDIQARFWLPSANIVELERKHGQPYRQWAAEGFLILTEGNTVDYAFVRQDIVRLAQPRNLIALFMDPWNSRKLGEDLQNQDGIPVKYLRQGYGSISDPTKTLHELVISGKIRHGGNPILLWHARNAVARMDPAGNVKLDKDLSRKKIDGMSALVNAIGAALGSPAPLIHSGELIVI